jgi:hypothetical protein
MTKLFWKVLKLSPAIVVSTFLAANSALANEVDDKVTSVSDLSDKSNIGQVTSVSQFSDVQPTDWAFQALQSLVERYGCIAGYPNGTYRGNRAMTRYEFAAGLNACLDRVNELIATATSDLVRKEDLATLQRLQEEFAAELATLRGRVDALEARTAELEANQFSTTTKLNGEVIFNVADVFSNERAFPFGIEEGDLADVNLAGTSLSAAAANTLIARGVEVDGDTALERQQRLQALVNAYGLGNLANDRDREIDGNTVFADRVRLNFDASFFGNDRLRVRIQARNINPFDRAITGTDQTRLGFDGSDQGGNDVVLDDLYYQFNLGKALRISLSAASSEFYDFIPTFNPAFESSGSGAISRYGRFSPIYRQGSEGAGVVVTVAPNSPISASVGYLAPQASNPGLGTGLIDGGYSAIGQISFRPSQAFNVGLTYARTYQNSEGGINLFSSTGSFLANRPFGNTATTSNNYGVQAVLRPSSKFILSGWAGYTQAQSEVDDGPFEDVDADIFYWAASLALQDFGKEGNTLGIIFGQPPKVTDSDVLEDRDTSYHLEALYKLRLSNNISITPGLLVIFNPEHNSNNDTTYVGTLRTTFTF